MDLRSWTTESNREWTKRSCVGSEQSELHLLSSWSQSPQTTRSIPGVRSWSIELRVSRMYRCVRSEQEWTNMALSRLVIFSWYCYHVICHVMSCLLLSHVTFCNVMLYTIMLCSSILRCLILCFYAIFIVSQRMVQNYII